MSKNGINKKQKVIRRFRTRSSVGAKLSQAQLDMEMADLVLKKLYNNGDKRTASLKEDILMPQKINFTQAGLDRLWEVLLSTGLVISEIGFGRSGRLELSPQGYQLMSQFGSYSNFIEKREEEAAKQNNGASSAQFILKNKGQGEMESGQDTDGQGDSEGKDKGEDNIAARKK